MPFETVALFTVIPLALTAALWIQAALQTKHARDRQGKLAAEYQAMEELPTTPVGGVTRAEYYELEARVETADPVLIPVLEKPAVWYRHLVLKAQWERVRGDMGRTDGELVLGASSAPGQAFVISTELESAWKARIQGQVAESKRRQASARQFAQVGTVLVWAATAVLFQSLGL